VKRGPASHPEEAITSSESKAANCDYRSDKPNVSDPGSKVSSPASKTNKCLIKL
jgi:hypothetical protein